MPNTNASIITPPRVPLIDPRTGLIDRAWYLFFLSLNTAANDIIDNPNIAPSVPSLLGSYDAALQALAQDVNTQVSSSDLLSKIAEQQKQIESLQAQPIIDVAAFSVAIAALSSIPITVTADFTVGKSAWYINNKSGSTCTVTLPTASLWPGRQLTFKNLQAQTLVSASSNVVLIDSSSVGTAILLAVVGNWATMVSDGINWVIMQQSANNCLLLE